MNRAVSSGNFGRRGHRRQAVRQAGLIRRTRFRGRNIQEESSDERRFSVEMAHAA